MSAFSKIKITGSWASYDSIDDKPLKNGELVEVLWPDGTVSEHKISLTKYHQSVLEQGGGAWDVPHHEAFVSIPHQGANLKVRLFDVNKIRVRRKKK
jgi:hypothetical protein